MTTERVAVRDAIVGRRGLSRRARATARATAETLFATDAGPPPADRLDWLADDLDDFVARSGPRARLVLGLCLLAISLSPLLVGRVPPFRLRSREIRARALERLDQSFLALALFAAKAMLCIVWYEHPENARAAGYDGSCLRDGAPRAEAP